MAYKFKGNLCINLKLTCETGLHIGSTQENYEIGGVDNPVIRDPATDLPYIPGSSLKGKMRSMLEWERGLIELKQDKEGNWKADPHTCEKIDCPVCRIFGTPAEKSAPKGPTRVIIRDAYPDDKTQEIFEEIELKKGLPKTELKWEVSIDRVTSKPPYGPRMIERVPKGSVFDLNIIFGLYDIDDNLADLNYLKYLFSALGMVEDSFLGGSGSRGSGRVSFKIEKLLLKTPEFYTGKDAYEILSQDLPTNPQDIDYKKIVEEIRPKIS